MATKKKTADEIAFDNYATKMEALGFKQQEIVDMWPKTTRRPEPEQPSFIRVDSKTKRLPSSPGSVGYQLEVKDLKENARLIEVLRGILNSVGDTMEPHEACSLIAAIMDATRRLRGMPIGEGFIELREG